MIDLIACSFPEDYLGKILEVRYSISFCFHYLVTGSAIYHTVLFYRQHIYWWHLVIAYLLGLVPIPFYSPCTANEYFALTSTAAFGTSFLLIYAWTNMVKERKLLAEHPELFKL